MVSVPAVGIITTLILLLAATIFLTVETV